MVSRRIFAYNDGNSRLFRGRFLQPVLVYNSCRVSERTSRTVSSHSRDRGKGSEVPGLHVHGTGTAELADQALAGTEVGYNASGGHALHHILAVPGHQVPVVDDILLSLHQLWKGLVQ